MGDLTARSTIKEKMDYHLDIIASVKEIEAKGFGEVKVVIQNGHVHHIYVSEVKQIKK